MAAFRKENVVANCAPCCLTQVLMRKAYKHLCVITVRSMWSLPLQQHEEIHVLEVE